MKKSKKNKRIKFITVILIFILVINIVPNIILLNVNKDSILQKNTKSNNDEKRVIQYNILDLVKYFTEEISEESFYYENNTKQQCLFDDEKLNIKINVKNLKENNIYTVIYGTDKNLVEEKIEGNKNIVIKLKTEGKNECYIAIKKNGEIIEGTEWKESFYYIKSYRKQFLDELSNKGICTHYQNGTWEIYNRSSKFLKALGVKYVRTDFGQTVIQKNDNTYDFSKYDEWINDLTNTSRIEPIILLNGVNAGEDYLINSNEEIEKFCKFVKAIQEHYPNFLNIEVLNEVNYASNKKGAYLNERDMKWYSQLLNTISLSNKTSKIMTAGTASTPNDQKAIIKSTNFIKYIYNTGGMNNINSIAYHPYSRKSNWFYSMIKEHRDYSNSIGGFNNLNVTEYGYSSSYCENDKEQGKNIIKMTVSLEETSNLIVLYNLWTTTANKDSLEKYGLLNVDYTPKDSYYIMKNYYEKTNGAEYIGNFKMSGNIVCHVFDKDGKILLIMWMNDENNTDKVCWSDNIEEKNIDYTDYTAYDLYGNKIENVNGKLTITSDPIYIEGASEKNYFKAINSIAVNKYNEFLDKYDSILNYQIKNKINQNIEFLNNLLDKENINQNSAVSEMIKNYEIGNELIELYKNGELNIEFVQLSSILDNLDSIGNSYEDLVTISSTMQMGNIEETKQKISDADKIICENEELNMTYPSKILNFGKDYYDKAEYINEIEEENLIKAGLITSKNLHAKLLADWANKFADLYIDDYIKNNPVEITYSKEDLTKEDVVAIIKTNAKIDITNNSNNKEYIFKENGTFTFEYEIKGRKLSIQAKVTNIDKTPPQITGIEQDGKYKESVTPQITDENLSEVKLIKDGQEVEYKPNTTITQEGIYQLTATDKAGNETTINFVIAYPEDEKYKIENNTIKNIKGETSVEKLKEKLQVSEKYTIKRKDTEIQNNVNIATGDILETESGNKYTLIVRGDLNKDGKVDIKDLVKMRKFLLLGNNLDESEEMAADTNIDGKEISIKDLVKMRIILLTQ